MRVRPRSLRSKLMLAFVAVLAFSLALASGSFIVLLRDYQAEREKNRLESVAVATTIQVVRALRLGLPLDEVEAQLDQLAEASHARILLLGERDLVIRDTDGERLTGGHQADVVLPLASLTKLVTALVVLDAPPDWSRTVTITADDLAYPQRYVNAGDITSEVPFQAGDRVTLGDLWAAMLIASSNQAAAILARETNLTPAAFTVAMNAKAASLGLQRTAFTEPSGLDVGNLGTAREMAAIARAAFAIPLVRETTLQRGVAIVAGRPDGATRTVSVVNRNASVLALGVDAAKTGFLIEAQRNLAVRKGDRIAVVLHARSMSERNGTIQRLLEEPNPKP